MLSVKQGCYSLLLPREYQPHESGPLCDKIWRLVTPADRRSSSCMVWSSAPGSPFLTIRRLPESR